MSTDCVPVSKKAFLIFFMKLMQIFSVFRNPSAGGTDPTFLCPVIFPTGIMPRKKGYSGTAIFTKKEPLNVTYGIGIEEHDKEGRVITLEYPDFYMVTCYTPNSQNELARLPYRMQWEDDFRAYLKKTRWIQACHSLWGLKCCT